MIKGSKPSRPTSFKLPYKIQVLFGGIHSRNLTVWSPPIHSNKQVALYSKANYVN